MATLTISKVFINNMQSGAAVGAQAARDRTRALAVEAEVRTYGGGRRRAVTRTGTAEVIDLTLRLVPQADVALLEAWLGQQVLYRDDRGRRLSGVYADLAFKEHVDNKGMYDVSLTLTGVTWQEGR